MLPDGLAGASDARLLALYAGGREGAAAAFEALVSRHGGMVHQTCLRILNRPEAAEDAAQAVFLILARKASSVRGEVGAFLHGVAVRVARCERRGALVRKVREQEALNMLASRGASEHPARETGWSEVRPQLDAAIERLTHEQRTAVVLHYLEGKSHREVGLALSISAGAATLRIHRALSKLREALARQGVGLSAVAIPPMLLSNLGGAACPPFLLAAAGSLSAAGSQAAGAAVVGAHVSALAQGALKAMFWAKLKLAAACVALAVAAGVVAVPVVQHFASASPQPPGVSKIETPQPSSANSRTSAPVVEGFGVQSRGGTGGDTYRVTSLADGGPGSLREGIQNRSGPRTIVFDVAGTISLASTVRVEKPFLTIDGSSAPAPGVTIRQATDFDEFIVSGTHDIVIRHLRFWGRYQKGGALSNNAATITIDGDNPPDHLARNIVLDHLTSRNAVDGGPSIWGEVQDVTVSWCFIFYSPVPTSINHQPKPFQTRRRISMHHNVYAKNGERNPYLRAGVRDLDFVNNVIYAWGHYPELGYGVCIRNPAGEPQVQANLINNYFLPIRLPEWALVYGVAPGPDAEDGSPPGALAQGTAVTTGRMGRLFVSGNVLPPENRDQYSTVAAPLAIPEHARVTTYPAQELKARVLPGVGMRHRDPEEQAILDELGNALR